MGLDRWTIAIGLLAVVLATGLSAVAATEVGVEAGVFAALAGLVPPAVLAVALARRQRNVELEKQRQALRKKYDLTKPRQNTVDPAGDREDEE